MTSVQAVIIGSLYTIRDGINDYLTTLVEDPDSLAMEEAHRNAGMYYILSRQAKNYVQTLKNMDMNTYAIALEDELSSLTEALDRLSPDWIIKAAFEQVQKYAQLLLKALESY